MRRRRWALEIVRIDIAFEGVKQRIVCIGGTQNGGRMCMLNFKNLYSGMKRDPKC